MLLKKRENAYVHFTRLQAVAKNLPQAQAQPSVLTTLFTSAGYSRIKILCALQVGTACEIACVTAFQTHCTCLSS